MAALDAIRAVRMVTERERRLVELRGRVFMRTSGEVRLVVNFHVN